MFGVVEQLWSNHKYCVVIGAADSILKGYRLTEPAPVNVYTDDAMWSIIKHQMMNNAAIWMMRSWSAQE